jgi:hypothetical protein
MSITPTGNIYTDPLNKCVGEVAVLANDANPFILCSMNSERLDLTPAFII